MADGRRAWCATFQFTGREPFRFGTVWMPHGAAHHEVEATCFRLLSGVLPETCERPRLVDLVPGMLVFVDEKQAEERAHG